jgi:hypothetical protein
MRVRFAAEGVRLPDGTTHARTNRSRLSAGTTNDASVDPI